MLYCVVCVHVCVYVCDVQACLIISRLAACTKAVMKTEDLTQFLSWSVANLGSQVRIIICTMFL